MTGRITAAVRKGSPRDAQSLKERAYQILKEKIITCSFRPGEYINEAFVSDFLKIGRTPVHQAIDRLMQDGLLEVIPRKGVIVRPISLDEIMHIVESRLVNETFCARLAAERAAPQDLAAIERILVAAARSLPAHDVERMMGFDRDFHLSLGRASKNPVLAEILGKLHDRSLRFWFISLNAPGHHRAVQQEHDKILAALKARDADLAEDAMREHIESFRRNLLQRI
jgi:DNA-binding GntR family transcriptional regulator